SPKPRRKAPERVSKPGTGGESVSARIVKAVAMLAAGGYDVDKNRARIKIAIKKLLENGTLVHTKGTGASGSFKLSKKADTGAKKSAKEAKAVKPPAAKKAPAQKAAKPKPVARKQAPKKPAAKKAAAKKTAAKK
uniref:H15 domain-containing protein n=1 Tax=Sphaeramia orbicularis TaxID=375764 RepID=A0A672ZH51_9TELE